MIDSHGHLNDKKLIINIDNILEKSKESGVSEIIVPGYDLFSSIKGVELAKEYSNIYSLVGIHPHDANTYSDKVEGELEKLLGEKKVVGLGEIGLDYFYNNSPKDIQKKVFIKQLHLAKKLDVPVAIHCRDAFLDTFNIIKEEGKGLKGVFHCFSGSLESSKKVIEELGFYISLGGPVTFKNAKTPKEVARNVPLEFLLIETDCPYLAPHPYRGKENNPSYLPLILEEIENLREEKIEEATIFNTRKLFKI